MHQIAHPFDLLAGLDSCYVLSFSSRQSNNILKLRRARNRTSIHLDHISSSGATSILASTMICIRESDKHLRLQRIREIGDAVVQGTLDVVQEMFDRKPTSPSRVGVESGQYSNSVGNI